MAASAGEASPAGSQQQPPPAKQYLYEPKYGLPVVRAQLSYSQLLRAIREDQVEEILFFSTRGSAALEGPCLVSFRDGATAQSFVPGHDVRIPYAMETHNVRGRRLSAAPTAAQLTPAKPLAAEVSSFLTNVLPYLAVAAVYAATSYVKWQKGDAADRVKIKEKAEEERKRREAEDRADRFLQDAEVLASQGWTVDAIFQKTANAGIKVEREQVAAVVARVQAEDAAPAAPAGRFNSAEEAAKQLEDEEAYRQKMKEQAAESDPNAQAEEFRKMKTVRVQKAQ